MRKIAAIPFVVIVALASMAALGCSEPVSASDPGTDHADAEAEARDAAEAAWASRIESGEVVAVQAADGPVLTGKDIDLPAVQSYCRAQSDQHYDDCVTVRRVIDALAGDCEDCRQMLGYRYSPTTGRVVAIDLSSKNLAGSIPTEIGELTALERVSLSSNELTGSIPSQIGNLTNLKSLWLYSNQLTGSIPPEIGNLTALEWLGMSSNQLTGTIPLELGNLTNLTYLSLDGNQLTGCVPASLQEAYSGSDYPICGTVLQTPFNLPAVQSHCRAQIGQHYDDCVNAQLVLDTLAGDCEDCHQTLGYRYSPTTGRVVAIDLGSKNLVGSIPTEIGELTALERVSLSSNELTGSIPSQIGNLTNLKSLWLYSNQLTGSIPPEIGNLTALEWLGMSSNQLTGTIPLELGNLTNLTYLSLDGNQLTGCVPASLQEAYSGSDYPICGTSLQTPTPASSPTPASPTPAPTPTPSAASTVTPTPVPDKCGSAVADSSNTGLVADCNTLLAARDTLRGTAALDWSPNTPISRWNGIALGGSPQRVIKVKLQKRGLSGQIPAALGRLDALEELWLYTNALTRHDSSRNWELGKLAPAVPRRQQIEWADTADPEQPDPGQAVAPEEQLHRLRAVQPDSDGGSTRSTAASPRARRQPDRPRRRLWQARLHQRRRRTRRRPRQLRQVYRRPSTTG